MRQGLAFLIGLVLICDLAVVGVHVLDEKTTLVTGPRQAEPRGPRIRPGPGQAFVSGDLERLVADNAHGQPLPTPFTITNVERGAGGLTIEKALVSGRRVTISWDGGTPLPISGDGALELGPAHLEVEGERIVWSLEGAGRSFQPGTYRIGAPVAVGAQGIATPRDRAEFTADGETVLAARGPVVVELEMARLEVEGPGKLDLTGRFDVQFPERKAAASSVRFGEGPFKVTIDPTDGRLELQGVLQGQVDVA